MKRKYPIAFVLIYNSFSFYQLWPVCTPMVKWASNENATFFFGVFILSLRSLLSLFILHSSKRGYKTIRYHTLRSHIYISIKNPSEICWLQTMSVLVFRLPFFFPLYFHLSPLFYFQFHLFLVSIIFSSILRIMLHQVRAFCYIGHNEFYPQLFYHICLWAHRVYTLYRTLHYHTTIRMWITEEKKKNGRKNRGKITWQKKKNKPCWACSSSIHSLNLLSWRCEVFDNNEF